MRTEIPVDLILALLALVTVVWNLSLVAFATRRARVATQNVQMGVEGSFSRLALEIGLMRDGKDGSREPKAPQAARRRSQAARRSTRPTA